MSGWLSVAVVLTGATQLRLPGLPVGPGEVLLAVWILFVGLLLLRGTVALSPVFRLLLLYWLAAFVLLGLGALMGAITGRQERGLAIHDSIAFVLVAMVTCFTALRWPDDRRTDGFQLQIARHTFFICTATTFALLVLAHHTAAIGPVRFWYAGVRFAGWAKNPNQMALFAVTMPFIGWYLLQEARGPTRKALYLAGIGAAIPVGLATLSDALRVSWIGALCTTGGLLWLRAIRHGRGRLLFIPYVIVPFVVIYFAATLGDDMMLKVEETVQRMYNEQDQGEGRITLWKHGMEAVFQSPAFGFGPGAYSGGTGPFQGSEAHNSYVDWGMSTGLLGIVLLCGLLAWCALRPLRAGELSLFGIVMAMSIFSTFGYTLRQPIYWLMLVVVLTLSERRLAAMEQPSRSPPLHEVPVKAI